MAKTLEEIQGLGKQYASSADPAYQEATKNPEYGAALAFNRRYGMSSKQLPSEMANQILTQGGGSIDTLNKAQQEYEMYGKVVSQTPALSNPGYQFAGGVNDTAANQASLGAVRQQLGTGEFQNGQPVDTSQPNPATTQINPPNAPNTVNVGGQQMGVNAPTGAFGPPNPAIRQGFENIKNTPAPTGTGDANSAVSQAVQQATPPAQPTAPTTPNVENFFNPQVNPTIQDTIKQLTDYFNPEATNKLLTDQLSKISTDQAAEAKLNTDFMNIQNVMSGTEDDLRNEVTKANGFATDSQIMALTIGRNKSLLKQATLIQQSLQTAQQAVANDVTLFQNEKEMANTQFNQRTQIYQLAQQNQQNIQNAAKDAIKTVLSMPGGLQAYASDPKQAAYAEQVMGFAPGTMNGLIQQQQQQSNLAQYADRTITSPYVNVNGEIQNTQTGQAYSSPQDFQKKTGMTLDQADAKGLIKPLGPTNKQQQQNFENQLSLEKLGIDKAQLGISQYNAQTSRMNASGTKDGMDEANLMGYAQQYAALGNIPAGIPKGSFGIISQIAKMLPKAEGTIISSNTGVTPPTNAFSNAQSDGLSATFNLIKNVLPSLKTSFNSTTTNPGTGLANLLKLRTGKVTDFNSKRTSFLNALLLANSGKVVSETELKRYQGLIPSLSTVNKNNGNRLLDQLGKELTDKMNTYLANNQLKIVGYDPQNPTGIDTGNANQFDIKPMGPGL